MRFAAARAAATSRSGSVPSASGTPASLATRRAAVFSPRSRCTVAGGPMKTRSAAATAWAKSAFSARKP